MVALNRLASGPRVAYIAGNDRSGFGRRGRVDLVEEAFAPSREEILRRLREAMPGLRGLYGVSRLAIYGSVARGEHGEGSDVDLLVELSRPLGFGFVELASYLEQTLGRSVDISTFDSLQRASRMGRRRRMMQSITRDLVDVQPAA